MSTEGAESREYGHKSDLNTSPEPVGYQRREKMKWPGKKERWKWVGTIYPTEQLARSCRSGAVLDFETRTLYASPPDSEIRALREALERIDTRCNQAVSGSAMLSAMVIDVIEIARTALEQTKEQIE